ncbi:acryloyl-CoA reductase [Radiobacillus kanasensis]|uniref:acrylyl-CoA reductase family protein n=1 Tax=Radiobacillus kanasensis TaxID=2844358 RepID=UPI001E64BB9F|nr:acryloyl-CoA reductase [Radiobacillus kanasensis]UFT99115.1 acryloyl-CoA reductase [Radiobacillus kanasensis]
MNSFQAFILNQKGDQIDGKVDKLSMNDLPREGVLIKVEYSSVNYKDGMTKVPNNPIIKKYPMVPGIDLAGEVVESDDSRFSKGDKVIATSYEIGVSHFGGYSEYARIPGSWIVPLPKDLTTLESMVLGTAGFTAALSIQRLEDNGITPEKGKVLVTGATGGVGSIAVSILARRGYQVVASTGKKDSHEYLKKIGAEEVIHRDEVYNGDIKAIDKARWIAAVDPVGGKPLASLLTKIAYGGSVAVSGLTGGVEVPTAVHPFILRGINLLGIDSVNCPMEIRKTIWERLSTDLKPNTLNEVVKEIRLEDLSNAFDQILQGKALGRMVVKL